MIEPKDIKDLVIGTTGDFTGGFLSALLLASNVARRFQPQPQKRALAASLEEALIEACGVLRADTTPLTKFYLDRLSEFLRSEIVIAEMAKLLEPQPVSVFEKSLLAEEFSRITQGYSPEEIPDLNFELFVETLVYAFYSSVKTKPELQSIIEIERLDQLVKISMRMSDLFAQAVEVSRPLSDGMGLLTTTTQEISLGVAEISDRLRTHLRGLDRLLTGYGIGIENFLVEYLGTEKHPVPFGGREVQLVQLTQWLKEGYRQRILLSAPAGRGKSALLVRWSQMLLSSKEWAVVFIPISVRFNTNLEEVTFSCLAARLAPLYGVTLPTGPGITSKMWRGIVSEMFKQPLPDSRNLLIILDGLDEAAWTPGPDLFPIDIPTTTRIVVSARPLAGDLGPVGWLQRLGWDSFELGEAMTLPRLTPSGIRDVLVKMGFPILSLGDRVTIVNELYRLSEGDPLVVRLYVDELWKRGEDVQTIESEDLGQIQPGIEGYFRKWWWDQRKLWGDRDPLQEKTVRALLNVLAVALGPLTKHDLHEILIFDQSIDNWLIDEGIKPISRFVLGDGDQQGFVFTHPRLSEFFASQLTNAEQRRLRAIYVEWGKRTMSLLKNKDITPRQVPKYLVQYYGEHLAQSKATSVLFIDLVNYNWMQSWHQLTGTYSGFLNDVDKSWARLDKANQEALENLSNAPYVGEVVKCALAHASVNSLASKIPDLLLSQLLQNGIWTETQAIAYSKQAPDPRSQAQALLTLLPLVSDERLPTILVDVISTIMQIENEKHRTDVLARYTNRLRSLSGWSVEPIVRQALIAANTIQHRVRRVQRVAALVQLLPQDYQVPEVLDMLIFARRLSDEKDKTESLAAIAPFFPHEVLSECELIESEARKAHVLTRLAGIIPLEVITTVYSIRSEAHRAGVLMALASEVPHTVINEAQRFEDIHHQLTLLVACLPHTEAQVQTELLDEILAKLSGSTTKQLAGILKGIAPFSPVVALNEALKVSNLRSRAQILVAVSDYVGQADRKLLLQEIRRILTRINHEGVRTDILVRMSPTFPDEVVKHFLEIEGEPQKSAILVSLSPYRPHDVKRLQARLKNENLRVSVLTALAPNLPHAERIPLLELSLKLATRIEDTMAQTRALTGLLPYLEPHLQTRISNVLLTAAKETLDMGQKADLLTNLGPFLPREVLDLALKIENEQRRVNVLTSLASQHPSQVLAEVTRIEDEARKARVLSGLVPLIPEKVYSIVPTLVNPDGKAHVLISLIPELPEEYRAELVARARESSDQITEPDKKVHALSRLGVYVYSEDREAVLNEAFTTAQSIRSEGQRARALVRLASYRPDVVFELALGFEEPTSTAYVLATMAELLPERKEEIVNAIDAVTDDSDRTRYLIRISSKWPDVALSALSKLEDPTIRVPYLLHLVTVLPKRRDEFLDEAMNELSKVRERRIRSSLRRTLSEQTGNADQHTNDLYRQWQVDLMADSRLTRKELLLNLRMDIVTIVVFGGQKAAMDTALSIEEVVNWWP